MTAPANLVHELSASTGTGNFTLTAQNGKQRFSTAFGTGATPNVFDYFISNQDAAEWERGTGHMSAVGTLVRDTVLESTNANAAVNFSAGTKDVCNDVPAHKMVRTNADWNAIGNGVANDTTAVSASFNSGGIVFVPAGTYLIDPITISTPVHIILHPQAVIKRRSATTGADSYLISFAAGSDGSTFQGGTIDGDRDSFAASFGSNPQALWPGVYFSGAARVTVRNMRFINHRTMCMWVGNTTGHLIENIRIENSDRCILFQFTDDSALRNVFATGIGNHGVAQYQHAFELRQLNRCVIENLRIDGYAPDALGTDPWPTAFIQERIFSCKVSGLFLTNYTGTEIRNYGSVISNASDSSFSDVHFDNVFWGIEFQTALNCGLNGFSLDGNFKTHASSDGYGIGLISSGVFQNNGDVVAFDTRANAASKQIVIANGIVRSCETGVLMDAADIHIVNVIANANLTYGFQTREIQTNGTWFPGEPRQRVENICLSNCQARFNGFDGVLIEAGTQINIDGGIYSDNGWDTSLGATFRAGVAMIEDASGGGVDRVSVANVYCGDTQTFTKTKGASFKPGTTDSNSRFTISLLDPDQIALGQWIKLVNATGSGDVTARVVDLNLDEAIVQCSGATTFADTSNLTALTGTISTSGNTVTGSGTAFTSEITGPTWIKVGSNYYHVQRVNSNTSMVIFPAPSPALSGASASKLGVNVVGIPSQQYGIVTDANVNGPLTLINVNADGAVTGATSIADASKLDIFGINSVMATAGVYAKGGRYAFGSTDLTQAQVIIAKTFADDNLLALQGQASGISTFGQFGDHQYWQASNIHLEIGTVTAGKTLAFRTAGTTRLLLTDTAFSPNANDGNALGTPALGWSDLFGATGWTLNIANGNWVATHTSGILTVGTGDLRVTTPGNNSASVLTFGGAYTTYTPTITAVTGTFTSVSGAGRWKQIGKTIVGTVTVTITTVGTAASGCLFTLPANAQASGTLALGMGRANNTGKMLQATLNSATQGVIFNYDNTTPNASGETLAINFTYEAA